MRKAFILLLFLFPFGFVYSQDTCFHFPVRRFNAINNPSFEVDPSSCASGIFNQFGLVIPFWSTPTNEMATGYLNACSGFVIPDSIFQHESAINIYTVFYPQVPQPIPDGNGVVAVSDFGYEGARHTYPFRKSYVSTCLNSKLEKDSLFRLDFYVGFGVRGTEILPFKNGVLVPEFSQSPEKFTLFGLTDCPASSLPLVGCPSVGGWIALGSASVSGYPGSWVQTSIQFRLNQDIQALALGPACDTTYPATDDTVIYNGLTYHADNFSYFLDKLELYKAKVPVPIVSLASGTLCGQTAVLQMQPAGFYAGSGIQWYRNNTLLTNEHNNTINISMGQYGEGWYQCRVYNDSVCLISDSFYLHWIPSPSPAALGNADSMGCQGDTILLNAYIDPTATYIWQDGSTLPNFSVTQNGTYNVTISNTCGTAQAQKTVHFDQCNYDLHVPNAFTPNGDGRNDVFRVHYSIAPVQFNMNVYDRYGQRVFSSSDPTIGWDGKVKGVQLGVDSFVWTIRYKDKRGGYHSLKGTVVLIR